MSFPSDCRKMPGSDSDSEGDSKNNKNSAESLTQVGKNTHHQPTVHKIRTQQTTRELPSWLTSPCSVKKLKKNRQVGRLPNTDSSESVADSGPDPQELLRKEVTPSLPSTVYCMSPAELYQTALLILQEEAKTGDSHQGTLEDASSSSKGHETSPRERSTPQGSTPQRSTPLTTKSDQDTENRVTPTPPSKSGKDETTGTGGAKLLDDIFFIPSSTVKPPPRKLKDPQKTQKPSRSPSFPSHCLAPDTVSTVPETAGFTAASIGVKESTTGLLGESLLEHKPEGTRANKGPDLSFLDEIF